MTAKQNLENLAGAMKNSRTGLRGVVWNKRRGRLQVHVQHNGRKHWGGYFTRTVLAEQKAIRLRNKLFTHNDADRWMP